jgi:ornithine cyclodeaminase/alanine dehydrogenase
MVNPKGTLLLTRRDLTSLAGLQDYIHAVETAFRMHAEDQTLAPGMLHVDSTNDVEFHIKTGGLIQDRTYFGLKANGSCFYNRERHGLPNILGVILLFDGTTGFPLAILDSIELTIQRTGAATAVAAKYLARPESTVATICGCGNQGKIQLQYVNAVLPITKAYAYDAVEEAAKNYAEEMSNTLSIDVLATHDLKHATLQSDVIITCTPARAPYVFREYVRPGTFIAGVGADSPSKHELDAHLLADNTVVVDILEQCARVGDLHHALDENLMQKTDVHAELGDLIAGRVQGRTSPEEITIYDATGTALQDTAAAALCYERAHTAGKGTCVTFFG